jgi:hypothetical protein
MQSIGWETNGIAADPMFVSLAGTNYWQGGGPPTNTVQNDFHLHAGSPCVGRGQSLANLTNALPGLAYDIAGSLRTNFNGGWDLGAYQH